jgi:hypothetical protein
MELSMEYKRVDFHDKKIFTQVMTDLLAVYDNHCIYVTNPDNLFNGSYDWDNIDVKKMLDSNDYKTFMSYDPREAIKYVHQTLGNDVMKKYRELGRDKAVSYLVVVEEYPFEGEDNYLVRGIIRGDMEGYAFSFNQEYKESIPKDKFEIYSRLDGNEEDLPKVYKKRRNK